MGFRTILNVPLMREGVAIGVISLRRTEVQLFTERQVALLETFADQAVIAIENVRLFQELQTRTRDLTQSVGELRALGEVSQAVGSTLDLETVLATIVSRAVQLSGSDQGLVYEFDEADPDLPAAGHAPDHARIRGSASGGAHQARRGSDGSGRGDPGARPGGRHPGRVATRCSPGASVPGSRGRALTPRDPPRPRGAAARWPRDPENRAGRLLARCRRHAADLRGAVGAGHPQCPALPRDPAPEAVLRRARRDEPGGDRDHGSPRHGRGVESRRRAALRVLAGGGPRPRQWTSSWRRRRSARRSGKTCARCTRVSGSARSPAAPGRTAPWWTSRSPPCRWSSTAPRWAPSRSTTTSRSSSRPAGRPRRPTRPRARSWRR